MRQKIIPTLGIIFVFCGLSFSHLKEKHGEEKSKLKNSDRSQLEKINHAYIKTVKPIFKNKCFDCHGTVSSLPWYSRIPGPKQIIQDDLQKAKEHLDMSEDFPFKGHGTPKEDLQAIKDSTKENTMPPLRYKVLHWSSGLEKDEAERILEWVETSLSKMNAEAR